MRARLRPPDATPAAALFLTAVSTACQGRGEGMRLRVRGFGVRLVGGAIERGDHQSAVIAAMPCAPSARAFTQCAGVMPPSA